MNEQIKGLIDKYVQLPPKIRDELWTKVKDIEDLEEEELEEILNRVVQSFEMSLVEPGEAIGTVAAQSIGEPGTQMSVPGDTSVIIKNEITTHIVPIGEYIDDLIAELTPYERNVDPSKSTICDIPNTKNLYVPSLGKDERVHWKRIIQVSRHLPNGELLKISTRSGRNITATSSHSFVIRKENKIIPIAGNLLRIGD